MLFYIRTNRIFIPDVNTTQISAVLKMGRGLKKREAKWLFRSIALYTAPNTQE